MVRFDCLGRKLISEIANEHIKKIYSDSELEEDATIRKFRIVQTEDSRQVTRDTKHYNLQMIDVLDSVTMKL